MRQYKKAAYIETAFRISYSRLTPRIVFVFCPAPATENEDAHKNKCRLTYSISYLGSAELAIERWLLNITFFTLAVSTVLSVIHCSCVQNRKSSQV